MGGAAKPIARDPGPGIGVAEAGEDQGQERRHEGRLLARARSRFLRGLHRG